MDIGMDLIYCFEGLIEWKGSFCVVILFIWEVKGIGFFFFWFCNVVFNLIGYVYIDVMSGVMVEFVCELIGMVELIFVIDDSKG